MIDLNDATTVKTLKFLDTYYQYRGKGKSIGFLLEKALGKNKDLHNETTLKTLYVVDALYRYPGKDIAFILREAMKESKSAGLAAQTQHQQTQQPPEVNLNGNYRDTSNF